ncbi:MAG: SDR family NAD(P)-dependent oxidoreductase [Polyangiaceae bacterium]|nr:SDR family NAD(P)-dependent oxidoreductase [Polyangiaceae bacterium]
MASKKVQAFTKHQSPWAATWTALRDLFRASQDIPDPDPTINLAGVHIAITGARSGLGAALARQLALQGAQLTLISRQSPLSLAKELSEISQAPCVALSCDLSDLQQVNQLITLLSQGPALNSIVLNAGLMAQSKRRTPQGLEEMFAVHCAANILLMEGLYDAQALVQRQDGALPQVLVTSSEAHRSSPDFSPPGLLDVPDFGMRDGIRWYGYSKLLFLAWVHSFAPDHPEWSIHTLCPGPINSNIAREAPTWVRPFLGPLMRLLFPSPSKAARPLLYHLSTPSDSPHAPTYLHMQAKKEIDRRAQDPKVAQSLNNQLRPLCRALSSPEEPGSSSSSVPDARAGRSSPQEYLPTDRSSEQ